MKSRCLGDRFSIMSNGDLHIRDVGSEDSHKPLRCTTYNTLTNDTRTSTQAMIYVIGNSLCQCVYQYVPRFLPARRYASAGLCDSDVSVRLSVRPSVRPSVCLSVTRRYCA